MAFRDRLFATIRARAVRLVRRHAGADVVVDVELEVRLEHGGQLALAEFTAKHAAKTMEPGAKRSHWRPPRAFA